MFVLFWFVLFFSSRSLSVAVRDLPHPTKTCLAQQNWEDLETWLSVATDSLLPKAAETLKHQTQDQLDDNITSLMAQDPSQSYSHKELARITRSLSHTLIATLKLSDKHAAQRQQELTRAQRRIEQLELEAQERQEGPDEVEQGTEEEINRLKETLAATSREMEQVKADYADRSKKLQYAEQLLEKAKADFRDKNGRIKALEAHLDKSRNEINCLTRQLDYIYIYIYAFSRRFYPKRLTLHSSYSFTFLSALAFPGNRTHDLGVTSAMLYHLSYRKAKIVSKRNSSTPTNCAMSH